MTDFNEDAPKKGTVVTHENMFAPELFVTEASFFSIGPGVITVTFVSHRWDNSTDVSVQKRVVVARLTMPIPGARGLAASLYDFLKKSGHDPVPIPEKGLLQ